ncbi:bifunctional riboflavin kinase/FAD synthetase [Aliikangiella coralliicola]|uniref:Riboflavin biosynthesis protein n=1 Tax=Aliikangiella coralliicola TaxID=2592383 RepID=A0A545UAA3_9GAMM|nr:bifunctional riboflavin kinase/FAD synthetase [Aliikangiella coralliicola]TQV86404.1 bifunctional riboflavin kinase/FAD synthetase [Aliikangiella coralliicola]
MKLIRGLINLQSQPSACVATIGNFDGVHLGHRAIVERLIKKAKQLGLPSCVLVFEPHPKEFFMGDQCPPRLSCFREKYQQLSQLGIDKLVVLQFNQALREMDAADFVNDILIEKLKIKHLVVGDDFRFGHRRQGNFQLLERMASGQYTLEPTHSILVDGERVSSTLIRQKLASGELEFAEKMLGRRYSMSGKVGYGQQLGRTLNFPTANVAIKRRRIPLSGVFLVKCRWLQEGVEQQAWGAANCGSRPTVDGNNYRLEVHLLGVSPTLYGIELSVDFLASIRAEQKFAGIDELKAQIAKDISQAKALIQKVDISR